MFKSDVWSFWCYSVLHFPTRIGLGEVALPEFEEAEMEHTVTD